MTALRIFGAVVGAGLIYLAPHIEAVRPGVPPRRVRWAQRLIASLGAACLVFACNG